MFDGEEYDQEVQEEADDYHKNQRENDDDDGD